MGDVGTASRPTWWSWITTWLLAVDVIGAIGVLATMVGAALSAIRYPLSAVRPGARGRSVGRSVGTWTVSARTGRRWGRIS